MRCSECFWQTRFSALSGLIVSTEGRQGSISLPGVDNQQLISKGSDIDGTLEIDRYSSRPPHLSAVSLYCISTQQGRVEQLIQICTVWTVADVSFLPECQIMTLC